jgi:hypothetical protein
MGCVPIFRVVQDNRYEFAFAPSGSIGAWDLAPLYQLPKLANIHRAKALLETARARLGKYLQWIRSLVSKMS